MVLDFLVVLYFLANLLNQLYLGNLDYRLVLPHLLVQLDHLLPMFHLLLMYRLHHLFHLHQPNLVLRLLLEDLLSQLVLMVLDYLVLQWSQSIQYYPDYPDHPL